MKPWKSIEAQLELLKSRGMLITDEELAKQHLSRIGYYRLSGYYYAFRKRVPVANMPKPTKKVLDEFLPDVTMKHVVDLYVFDKKLRLLVMDALERIEIAMRSSIAHTLGEYDPVAYLNPQLFHSNFVVTQVRTGLSKYDGWQSKQERLINESREEFILHHKSKYGLPVPIWVAAEVWDFGAMSHLFSGMKEADQDKVSRLYGIENGRIFATWLRSLNYLRNVCAHHGRLWNRNIVEIPKLPPKSAIPWVGFFENDNHASTRVFVLLCVCTQLLNKLCPQSKWNERLIELLNDFPDIQKFNLNLSGMGAKKGWEEALNGIWKTKNP